MSQVDSDQGSRKYFGKRQVLAKMGGKEFKGADDEFLCDVDEKIMELLQELDLPEFKRDQALGLYEKGNVQDLDAVSVATALTYFVAYKEPVMPRPKSLIRKKGWEKAKQSNALKMTRDDFSKKDFNDRVNSAEKRFTRTDAAAGQVKTVNIDKRHMAPYICSILDREQLSVFAMRKMRMLLDDEDTIWGDKDPAALIASLVYVADDRLIDSELETEQLAESIAKKESTIQKYLNKLEDSEVVG